MVGPGPLGGIPLPNEPVEEAAHLEAMNHGQFSSADPAAYKEKNKSTLFVF